MTSSKKLLGLWLSVGMTLLLTVVDAAAPTTIDFEELTADDVLAHYVGPVYAKDGLVFTASVPQSSGNTPGFGTFGTVAPSFVGSTFLFNINGNGGTTLTRADGGKFTLFSIDLAETPNFDPFGIPVDLGSFTLSFVGIRANGSTVRATANIDPFPSVTTFKFPKFTNVVSVMWFQGGGGASSLTHQFDNVRVSAGSVGQ
jgi:hypothetical protein